MVLHGNKDFWMKLDYRGAWGKRGNEKDTCVYILDVVDDVIHSMLQWEILVPPTRCAVGQAPLLIYNKVWNTALSFYF
jgi:hypothetical protein